MCLTTIVLRHLHWGNKYNLKKSGLLAEYVPNTFQIQFRRINIWTDFLDTLGIRKAETYMNQKHNYTVYFLKSSGNFTYHQAEHSKILDASRIVFTHVFCMDLRTK